MFFYKNLLYFLISCLFFFSFSFAFDFKTDCQEKNFVVTAYYSPKSGQVFYYKDSFQAEVKLNGSGTHGASGKPVFNGMLAAPSTYEFGGKIYFPSLGIGEIADRGGAIVHAGEKGDKYDRIDIWMGEGEEGLIRALTFGKRTIVGYYCDNNALKTLGAKPKVGLDFDAIPILKYFFDSALFIQALNEGRTDVRVYKLQEYLIKFGYMDKKTGYFGPETKKALCSYQIKRKISTKKYCGTFGSATRYYMKNDAKKRGFLPDFSLTSSFKDLILFAKSYNQKEVKDIKNSEITTNKYNTNYFNQSYKKDEQNEQIYNLQDMFRHYGFYKGELNNIYDKDTINAVHNFQVAKGILKASDTKNPARGWMGPSTRKALNEKWAEFQEFKNALSPGACLTGRQA